MTFRVQFRRVTHAVMRYRKDISGGGSPHEKATDDSSDWDFGSRDL